MPIELWRGLLIPFAGTTLGAACVFFMRSNLGEMVQRALTGFAAGVMMAASIWSLLLPAMEQAADMGRWSFVPAVAGFWLGILFLLGLDRLIPHLHRGSAEAEIISMPLKAEGFSKSRSFLYGTLSGAVETIGAILTILLAGILVPVLPYALSFAAGAMVYVVVEELIPEMSVGKHSNIGTILFAVGFTLMMTLDVALGACVSEGERLKHCNLGTIPKKGAQNQAP